MRKSPATILRLFPVVFLVALTAGCSEKSSTINGKLVLPAGVKLEQQDSVVVSFVPDPPAEGKNGATAPVNAADLTFAAKGVAPGKYKVSVIVTPYPGPDSAKRTQALQPITDRFNAQNTKLRYDVTSDSQQSITIDLAKDKVDKG